MRTKTIAILGLTVVCLLSPARPAAALAAVEPVDQKPADQQAMDEVLEVTIRMEYGLSDAAVH